MHFHKYYILKFCWYYHQFVLNPSSEHVFVYVFSFSSDLTNSFCLCYIKMSDMGVLPQDARPSSPGWESTSIPACVAPGGAGLKRTGPIHKVSFKQSSCATRDWREKRRQLVFTHTVSFVCPTEGHHADAELGKYTESDALVWPGW